jgi:hypothetical protein
VEALPDNGDFNCVTDMDFDFGVSDSSDPEPEPKEPEDVPLLEHLESNFFIWSRE